ncbi:hypothetical protein [Niveibacterium sp. SC-1]|uniref:hypothetical protein n=1 Tax=Niveibacterium sp. SC-1 TaxID=3135646 RepID=UPI00311FB4FC
MIMKAIAIAAVSAASLFAMSPAFANDAHHPDKQKPDAAATAAAKDSGVASGAALQDQMSKMQSLMTRIRASEDPAERSRLLQEHTQAMQDGMRMMAGTMSGGGMKAGDNMMLGSPTNQSAPHAGRKASGMSMKDCPMMAAHAPMMQRMDMMQAMMAQMLAHQSAAEHVPGGK